MNLKNHGTCADLRSENPIEARALLRASTRSYSPRSSGLMPNEDQMLILTESEAEGFVSGVLTDVDLCKADKWAIARLVSAWLSGEVTDEAFAPFKAKEEA